MSASARVLNRVIPIDTADLPEVGIDSTAQEVREGSPRIFHLVVDRSPDGKVERGIWEATVGTFTDVEYDELFVVIRGRATVTFVETGNVVHLEPGTFGLLADGAKTVWEIHEDLRKAYQITFTRPPRW